MQLWEDVDVRDVSYEAKLLAEARQDDATLHDLVSVGIRAIIRLYQHGRSDLLRIIGEAIPVKEFASQEEKDRYIDDLVLGEVDPTRAGMVLLYQHLLVGNQDHEAETRLPRYDMAIKSGLRGVGIHRGQWRVQVDQTVNGRRVEKYLGTFATRAEAIQAHDTWVRQHLGPSGKLATDNHYHQATKPSAKRGFAKQALRLTP